MWPVIRCMTEYPMHDLAAVQSTPRQYDLSITYDGLNLSLYVLIG